MKKFKNKNIYNSELIQELIKEGYDSKILDLIQKLVQAEVNNKFEEFKKLKKQLLTSSENSLDIDNFYSKYKLNLNNYKFNREEANER